MVAAQIRSGLSGTARSCITMAERHVGARQRAFAVASSGRLTTVENRPVGGSEPVLHQRSDAVRFGAPRVPERVAAIDVAQDEDVFAGREAVQGEAVHSLVLFGRSNRWSVDTVDIDITINSVGLTSTMEDLALKDTDGAPLSSVVLREEGRFRDGLEVQSVADEDQNVRTFDGPTYPPSTRPLGDHGRLIARDVDGGCRPQLGLLNRAHVDPSG